MASSPRPATSPWRSPRAGRGRGGREGAPARGGAGSTPPPEDPAETAQQICLHQMEHAPRTRAELAAALRRKGIPDDVADGVLSRFAEVGIVDDALFARLWVSSRARSRGLSGRALGQELRRKGIEDAAVAEALAGIDPDGELATARALVDRRIRSTAGLPADARVRRLTGMLARKGYPAATAFRVVREALAAEGERAEEADELLSLQDEL